MEQKSFIELKKVSIEVPKRWDSPAEEIAFPTIQSFCEKYLWGLEYQVPMVIYGESGWRDWVLAQGNDYKQVPEWIEREHDYYCEGEPCKHVWVSNDYERYIVDFVLTKIGRKVGIEIDGKEWHDVKKDERRDKELVKDWGFLKIVRIPASDVYRKKQFFKTLELELLNRREKRAFVSISPIHSPSLKAGVSLGAN